MVMFLFVIAYLGDKTDEAPWAGGPSWQVVGDRARRRRDPRRGDRRDRALDRRARSRTRRPSRAASARPASIGRVFLTDQLLAFEVTSIVLLVAAVGGVVLGSHARAQDARQPRSRRRPQRGDERARHHLVHHPRGDAVRDRRARRAVRRSPLIILLSVEIMLNGSNLALIAFARHFGQRGRPGLRDRRDGDRRLRGRRRPRADRRHGAAQRRARRRQAPDPARMTINTAAWVCLCAAARRGGR